jgi:hypothetical protein
VHNSDARRTPSPPEGSHWIERHRRRAVGARQPSASASTRRSSIQSQASPWVHTRRRALSTGPGAEAPRRLTSGRPDGLSVSQTAPAGDGQPGRRRGQLARSGPLGGLAVRVTSRPPLTRRAVVSSTAVPPLRRNGHHGHHCRCPGGPGQLTAPQPGPLDDSDCPVESRRPLGSSASRPVAAHSSRRGQHRRRRPGRSFRAPAGRPAGHRRPPPAAQPPDGKPGRRAGPRSAARLESREPTPRPPRPRRRNSKTATQLGTRASCSGFNVCG